jgi:2-polyprenyl-3-methyl-5-hydroxy-6-metoxy-1,4-benzoquinol methylase
MEKNFSLGDLNQQGTHYGNESFTNDRTYIYIYRYKTVRQRMTGPKVLEVGIGNADITDWLSKDGRFEVVSIDGSQSVLDYAVKKITYPERVSFVYTYFEEFSSDIMFDDILVTNSLEHVDNPIKLLCYIKKFLKPTGNLHITVPNAMSIHRILGKEMGMLKHEDSLNQYDIEVGHQRVYTINLLKEHVSSAGFKVIDQDGIILKPLSDSQMNTVIDTYGEEVMMGLYAVGQRLPGLAAEIYFCCRKII